MFIFYAYLPADETIGPHRRVDPWPCSGILLQLSLSEVQIGLQRRVLPDHQSLADAFLQAIETTQADKDARQAKPDGCKYNCNVGQNKMRSKELSMLVLSHRLRCHISNALNKVELTAFRLTIQDLTFIEDPERRLWIQRVHLKANMQVKAKQVYVLKIHRVNYTMSTQRRRT